MRGDCKLKKILFPLLGAGVFTAVKVIKEQVERRKYSKIYDDHICPECSMKTLEEYSGGAYLVCEHPGCGFYMEYQSTDIKAWEELEAQEQEEEALKKKDNSYLEEFKESKFADTYRGYLIDLLSNASYFIGSKRAISIFLDEVVAVVIHKNTFRSLKEINKKLQALNANEIYDYMCEVGIDPNSYEGMLSYELDEAYKDIGLDVITKMDLAPFISIKDYMPEKRYYKLVHYYDNNPDERALFIETAIMPTEKLIYILSSLQFIFEDLIDESISVEPTHLMAILEKYYDIKDVTDSFQVCIPYTQLPKDEWETVINFDLSLNETEKITIIQVDLYSSRERCCGKGAIEMMDKYLPKDKSFEQDILKFKKYYDVPF